MRGLGRRNGLLWSQTKEQHKQGGKDPVTLHDVSPNHQPSTKPGQVHTSVLGNEASIRFGRRRLIVGAMVLSIAVGLLLGFVSAKGYWLAVGLIVVYGMIIWLDSSSLTAGAAGAADPARRGAALAVHSMLGYADGFVGPLAIGWTLDAAGGMSPLAWGLAFGVVAVLMALAMAVFIAIRPRELEGDHGG